PALVPLEVGAYFIADCPISNSSTIRLLNPQPVFLICRVPNARSPDLPPLPLRHLAAIALHYPARSHSRGSTHPMVTAHQAMPRQVPTALDVASLVPSLPTECSTPRLHNAHVHFQRGTAIELARSSGQEYSFAKSRASEYGSSQPEAGALLNLIGGAHDSPSTLLRQTLVKMHAPEHAFLHPRS